MKNRKKMRYSVLVFALAVIYGQIFAQDTAALHNHLLTFSNQAESFFKDGIKITINTDGLKDGLKDTLGELSLDGSHIIASNILEGAGKGTSTGLIKFLKALNSTVDKQGIELNNMAQGYSKHLSRLINTVTGELFNPHNGPFVQFGNLMTQLGNKWQSQIYWRIMAPLAGKIILTGVVGVGTIQATRILLKWAETQLYKPTVITGYYNVNQYNTLKNFMFGAPASSAMIFHPLVKNRLNSLIKETQNTYTHIKAGKSNVVFANILLSGAPGTGKTMFAKKLAQESGMSYAFVSAGSFFQEGAGIAAIKELFAWAQKSKGLLLFIDEADALFVDRTKLKADSDHYKIICEFLTYLGEKNNKFMLIMATNHKAVFDYAMQSRIDDLIEIPLPDTRMREHILTLYSNTVLFDKKNNGAAFVKSARDCMTPECIASIAQHTDGFSNRDLQAIIQGVLKKSFATDNALVTAELIDQVVYCYTQKREAFNTVLLSHNTLPVTA